jgi:hypothetical protein
MIYTARYKTNIGDINAIWRGHEFIEVYKADDEVPELINVFDYEAGKLSIGFRSVDVANFVLSWLWEMERGIEIFEMTHDEISELDNLNDGNYSPS